MNGENGNRVPKAKSNWSLMLGLFIGLGLGATIGIVGLEYFIDRMTFFVIALVAVLVIVSAIFLAIAFYRKQILAQLFKGAQGSLDEAVNSSGDALQEFSKGDYSKGSSQAMHALREVAALYTWSRFRWLVVTLFLALIATIAAFSNSMLVFRQNKLIQEQNDLIDDEKKLVDDQKKLLEQEIAIYEGEIENQTLQLRSSISGQASIIYDLVDEQIRKQQSSFIDNWEQNLKKLNVILRGKRIAGGSWDNYTDVSTFESFQEKYEPIANKRLFKEIAWSNFYLGERGENVLTGMPDIGREFNDQGFRKALYQITFQLVYLHEDNGESPQYITANARVRIFNFLDSLSSKGRLHAEAYREAKADLLLGLIRLRADLQDFYDGFSSISFRNRRVKSLRIRSLNLSEATFEDVIFQNVEFSKCNLAGAVFKDCTFENCRFPSSFLPPARNFISCSFDWKETFHESYVSSADWLTTIQGVRPISEGEVRGKYSFDYYLFEGNNVVGGPLEFGLTPDTRGLGYSFEIRKRHSEIEGELSGIGDVFFERNALAIRTSYEELRSEYGDPPRLVKAKMEVEATIVWTLDGWPMPASAKTPAYALAFQSEKNAIVKIQHVTPSTSFSFDQYRKLLTHGANKNIKIQFWFPQCPFYAQRIEEDEKP